jgi:hypothetical protein
MRKAIVFMLLFVVGSLLMAQANQGQSQPPAKSKEGKVTVQGCVSRSFGDFVLMQSDPANSFVLEPTRKIKLEPYLGQQVEVTGTESPTMSTSSSFRKRAGSSVTIMVDSINTISKRCGS